MEYIGRYYSVEGKMYKRKAKKMREMFPSFPVPVKDQKCKRSEFVKER